MMFFLQFVFFLQKSYRFGLTYEAVLRVNVVCVIAAWVCYFGRPKIDRGPRVFEEGRYVGVPAGLLMDMYRAFRRCFFVRAVPGRVIAGDVSAFYCIYRP